MHDLHLERFGAQSDGPMKTFVLRGIKDSLPYFHDGRLLTLEDTVEFSGVRVEAGPRGEISPRRLHAGALRSATADADFSGVSEA